MASDEWCTPPALFAALDEEFFFELDPCCTAKTALCSTAFRRDIGDDGLSSPWDGLRAFVNPPYSRGNLEKWCKKCVEERRNADVVALLPCDCSPSWWRYVMMADEIRFLPRRVRFLNPETGKPAGSPTFGSVIAVWRRPGYRYAGPPSIPMVYVWDWLGGRS
ncbi:MAG: adenine methyltransferase [Synergistales bacterium]|nr:adenine methyltransferase [Synergistales bacterium]